MQAYIDIYFHANDNTGSGKFVCRPYLENRLVSQELTPFKVRKFCFRKHEFSSVSNAESSTQALIMKIKEDLQGFGNLLDNPTDKQADNLTDNSTDTPTDDLTDTPTEIPTDNSTDDSTDIPTDNHAGKQTARSLPDSHLSKQLETRVDNCQKKNNYNKNITTKAFCHARSVNSGEYLE